MIRNRWLPALLALFILIGTAPRIPAKDVPKPIATENRRSATWEGKLYLRVPMPKGGFKSIAKKYTGNAGSENAIRKATPRKRGRKITEARVPFDLLLPAYRKEVLGALFPQDRRVTQGWEHPWKKGPLAKWESWGAVASWFTGSSKNAPNLKEANKAAGSKPKNGEVILIPEGLLWKPIKELPPPHSTPKSGPGLPGEQEPEHVNPPAEQGHVDLPTKPVPYTLPQGKISSVILEYGKDAQGEYALYRLQQGEALYSAVAVRFTGRINAADVNEMAMRIAKRSGIKDVTDIPINYPVKIPLEELLPQYLPHSNARYKEWLANRQSADKFTNTFKSAALDGVVVILDAGHGGRDRGAMKNDVWEDSYVYDIACRIRRSLERFTKARVLMTLHSPSLGYEPQDKEKLTPNTDAVILTHPWHKPESKERVKVGVNLRWYLSNDYFLHLKKEGVDPHHIVFTSIHADSLHPSLRGAMFYIPGKPYRSTKWSVKGSYYQQFEEVKRNPSFRVTSRDLNRSEGLSRQFTRTLESSFSQNGLAMHPYSPTRTHVIRGRRHWVPAVLRNNLVPCSVLIEVCNINNPKDAKLLRDPKFRQKIADAYIEALIRYYS